MHRIRPGRILSHYLQAFCTCLLAILPGCSHLSSMPKLIEDNERAIQASSHSIRENQKVIEDSTQAIAANEATIRGSTQTLESNQQQVEKLAAAVQEVQAATPSPRVMKWTIALTAIAAVIVLASLIALATAALRISTALRRPNRSSPPPHWTRGTSSVTHDPKAHA